jgi:hypothetical protein
VKSTFVALFISMAAFNLNAMDFSQAQEGVSHSSRMASAAQARINDAQSRAYESGTLHDSNDAQMMNSASEARANAIAEERGYAAALANAVNTQSQQDANYGIKGNANLTNQVKGMQQAVSYSGVSPRQGYGATINVAVSSLKPDTKVSVTVNGVTKVTTAAAITAVNPEAQIAVSHVSAFQANPGKGSKNDQGSSHSVGGSGNGANNAANTHSAHGLGGGDHIGGGSAMGGGFHGSW